IDGADTLYIRLTALRTPLLELLLALRTADTAIQVVIFRAGCVVDEPGGAERSICSGKHRHINGLGRLFTVLGAVAELEGKLITEACSTWGINPLKTILDY